MSEIEPTLIRAGRVVIEVKWRDLGSDRGITVNVDVEASNGTTAPVTKFDLFEAGPHWHQCHPDRADVIEPMAGDPMEFTVERLRSLPELLSEADQDEVAASLSEEEVALIVDRVRQAVHSLVR